MFDQSLTFTPHVKPTIARCNFRLNILKALAGTTWDHQKKSLLTTYNALMKPVITYAAPIWYPSPVNPILTLYRSSKTKHSGLYLVHTTGLTSITFMWKLPIQDHFDILCSQFLYKNLIHPMNLLQCLQVHAQTTINLPSNQSSSTGLATCSQIGSPFLTSTEALSRIYTPQPLVPSNRTKG